ncbi:MAG: transposase [Candidatus Aenigmarchaeota archaeon]|nr:transposase [Candidatus Aenigmarchaeota archaeon]
MDPRQERGQLLAQDKRIKHVEGAMWFCPSQTQNAGGYLVNLLAVSCTCPDYELRRCKCKHQWAVEFRRTVEMQADGSQTVTESVKVTRKTYKQDWPKYNAAQCAEKGTVQALLHGLCDGIQWAPRPGRGKQPIPLPDAVYGMVMKVYTGFSGRRATTDLRECAEAGHMRRAPRYNTLFDYFDKPELTPLLKRLIEDSAAPLASIETQFAADSTGFGTATYRRWYDAKYGREMKEHGWIKAHAMVGTFTNVITSANVTDSNGNDSPELPGLLIRADRHFALKEVSADKAYLAHSNLKAIEDVGAVPYIPFKSNSKSEGSAAWRRMWGLFISRSDEFLNHYHQRSNVESTFSAIKRKFGSAVRSKTFTAQVNEVLCKILCHNLSCLVHAMFELGIQPTFPVAQEVAA